MNVCGKIIGKERTLLHDNILEVNGLRFVPRIWVIRDMKWLNRSVGAAGQSAIYYCGRCMATTDSDGTRGKRTTEIHNSMATMSQINPWRFDGSNLQEMNEGCKIVGISPVPLQFLGFDELHMDLNMALFFIKIAKRIMIYCQENEMVVSQKLKWTIELDMKDTEAEMEVIWAANDKIQTGSIAPHSFIIEVHKISPIAGYMPTASNLSSNPGNVRILYYFSIGSIFFLILHSFSAC